MRRAVELFAYESKSITFKMHNVRSFFDLPVYFL